SRRTTTTSTSSRRRCWSTRSRSRSPTSPRRRSTSTRRAGTASAAWSTRAPSNGPTRPSSATPGTERGTSWSGTSGRTRIGPSRTARPPARPEAAARAPRRRARPGASGRRARSGSPAAPGRRSPARLDDPGRGLRDGPPDLRGFEDLGLRAVLEDVAHDPFDVGDPVPDDDAPVRLLFDRPLLPDPARDPGRVADPDLDLVVGAVQPAETGDPGFGVEVGRPAEPGLEDRNGEDPIRPEKADRVPHRTVADQVPSAAGVADGVGMHDAFARRLVAGLQVLDPAASARGGGVHEREPDAVLALVAGRDVESGGGAPVDGATRDARLEPGRPGEKRLAVPGPVVRGEDTEAEREGEGLERRQLDRTAELAGRPDPDAIGLDQDLQVIAGAGVVVVRPRRRLLQVADDAVDRRADQLGQLIQTPAVVFAGDLGDQEEQPFQLLSRLCAPAAHPAT